MSSSPVSPPDETIPRPAPSVPDGEGRAPSGPATWVLLAGPPFAAAVGGLLAAWIVYSMIAIILLGYIGVHLVQGIDSEIREIPTVYLFFAAAVELYAALVGGVLGAAGGLLLGMVLALWKAIRPAPAFLGWSRRAWALLGGAVGLAIPVAILIGLEVGADMGAGPLPPWELEDVLALLWFVVHGPVGGVIAGMLFFGLALGHGQGVDHASLPSHSSPHQGDQVKSI